MEHQYAFLYDVEELKTEANALAEKYKKNTGHSDFVRCAVDEIADRIMAEPIRYREYGVYWPSICALFRKYGKEVSQHIDSEMERIYKYDDEALLIAAAERMADWNRKNLPQGASEFDLTVGGELVYYLNDFILEMLISLEDMQ